MTCPLMWHLIRGGVEILRIFGNMSVFYLNNLYTIKLNENLDPHFHRLSLWKIEIDQLHVGSLEITLVNLPMQLGSTTLPGPRMLACHHQQKPMPVSKMGNSNPNLYWLVMRAVMKMAWMGHFFSIQKWRAHEKWVRHGLHPGWSYLDVPGRWGIGSDPWVISPKYF